MTFRDLLALFAQRMTADVGQYQPRWLYLLYKPLEVLGLTLGVHVLTGTHWLAATAWACGIHTLIGAVRWWTRHPVDAWGIKGRGGVLGDTVYHAWIGAGPFLVLFAMTYYGRPAALLLAFVWLLWWFAFELLGFGVVRSGA